MTETYRRSDGHLWSQIFYEGALGTRPKVAVSLWKHANYKSVGSCDQFLTVDNCAWDDPEDLKPDGPFTHAQNLGSPSHRLVDCVPSRFTAYSLPGTECFWTGTAFDGWSSGSDGVSPYKDLLADFGM